MKYAVLSAAVLVAITAAASRATTVTGTIPVSAQIVPGTTVSAFVVRGEAISVARSDSLPAVRLPYGAPPIAISFPASPSEIIVRRASWDPALGLLTLDF